MFGLTRHLNLTTQSHFKEETMWEEITEEEYEQMCWDHANNIVDEYEDYGLEWGVDTL